MAKHDLTGFDVLQTPVTGQVATFLAVHQAEATGGERLPSSRQACFAPGTMIATPLGARAIEDLRAGDLVRTVEGRYVAVLWVAPRDAMHGGADTVVRIEKGALGQGLPTATLYLAPDHGVRITSRIAEQMFGQDEVLVPAESLVGQPGITRARPQDGQAIHLLLEGHHVVIANGLPVESLFVGKDTRARIGRTNWKALRAALPREPFVNGRPRMTPARLRTDLKRARRLIERHLRNPRCTLIDAKGLQAPVLRLVTG